MESTKYWEDCGEALEGNISAEWNVLSAQARWKISLVHLAIAYYKNYKYASLLSFTNFSDAKRTISNRFPTIYVRNKKPRWPRGTGLQPACLSGPSKTGFRKAKDGLNWSSQWGGPLLYLEIA